MKKIFIVLFSVCILSGLSAEIVDNNLGRAFLKIFPELKDGYIDLNHNGKLDRLDDMDELVPDSRVKDGIIQVQEIMDFVSVNYPFFMMNELKSIQSALEHASGTIPELIGLNYLHDIKDLIRKKEALGIDGLYLSASAKKEAAKKMTGLIAAMVSAYKNEGAKDETAFNNARDELFTMIEQGYPIVSGLPKEDKNVLVSALIQTARSEKDSNAPRVKYAVKTLGKLKDAFAVPYIIDLMNDPRYKTECIKALGEIGNSDAEKTLIGMLDSAKEKDVRIALYMALGRIGGEAGLSKLVALLQQEEKPSPGEEYALLQAVSRIAQSGNPDRRINSILTSYLSSPDGDLRVLAARGLAAAPSQANMNLLLGALRGEKDEAVKIELVKALNIEGNVQIINMYTAMLRDPSASEPLQKTIIEQVGKNSEGVRAAIVIQPYLGSKVPEIRLAAKDAFLSLYQYNPKTISSILARAVATTDDELLETEASGLLADMADPDTTQALSGLLKSPYPEVKQNATWGLYKIGDTSNPRIIEDLKRMITSETEPMEVRINAVRSLGSSGTVSDDIIQTLLTTVKMRGDKYSILRYFALQALGQMDVKDPETVDVIAKVGASEKNQLLKKAALIAVKNIGIDSEDIQKTLEGIFKRNDDPEMRTLVIETLGDLGEAAAADLAEQIKFSAFSQEQKQRIVYALSKCATDKAFNLIITNSRDSDVSELAVALLQDTPARVLSPIIDKRLRTESDKDIVSILDDLKSGYQAEY